jgi:hypothetical protein
MKKLKISPLYLIGLGTLIGFPLLGWGLIFLVKIWFNNIYPNQLLDIFSIESTNYYLLPIFTSIGIVFGLIVIWLTELKYFEKSMSKYKNLLDNYKLNTVNVIFLSICAGVGEEIFFRGALQPILGIWATSVFFVAIHGYFSFKDMRVNIFAIMLTLFIGLLGWASQTYSIWLAIVAHFSYDLVLLFYYKNNQM